MTPRPRSSPGSALGLVHLACLLSGTAALAYEVLWSRILVVSLGNSADAGAAVLVAFMGAMGIGAVLAGRAADRVRDPLLLYCALEGILALCALAVPGIAATALPRAAAALLGPGSATLAWLVRLALATALVAVPAGVMGATLPLLARRIAREPHDAARLFGILYMVNTLGGCVGAAAAGLFVVPAMGIRTGSGLAALLNLGAAAAAYAASRLQPTIGGASTGDEPREVPRVIRAGAAVLAVTSGALMLLLERMWSRLLVLVLGHDTYGFASMLVAAILGLALGGALAAAVARRRADALAWACALIVVASALALGCSWATTYVLERSAGDPFGILAASFLTTNPGAGIVHPLLVALLPALLPSVAAGAVFPLTCAAVDPRPASTGAVVGRLTALNAAGCVVGALAPTLGLVQWLGVQGSITAAAGAASGAGMLVALRTGARRAPAWTAAAALVAVATLAVLFPSGAVRRLTHVMVGGADQRILYHAEGRTGTVTVTRDEIDGVRQLFVNAVNEVTTRTVHDQSFSLLGHLGVLLHPDPRTALVICHGAGLTAGAVATHEELEVTVVDLESKVVEAATMFSDLNGDLAHEPRVKVLIEDGRNHLLRTDATYDVITVDSTHPRAVDSWVLYTTEFYQLARSRLGEEGILVQWVPLHGMSERELGILTRTFLTVFPHAQLWANVGYDRVGFTGYALLVGSAAGPLFVDADRVESRMKSPRVRAEMGRFYLDGVIDVLDCFMAGPDALRRWTDALPVNEDDRPLTPFVTGWSAGPRVGPQTLSQVAGALEHILVPPEDPARARALASSLAAHDLARVLLLRGEARRASEVVPGSRRLARYVEELEGARLYQRQRAARSPDDPRVLLDAGAALTALGDGRSAQGVLVRASSLSPRDPRVLFELGLAQALSGEPQQAEGSFAQVLEIDPGNVLALNNLALAVMALGDPYEATRLLRQAARTDPDFHRTWYHLGEAHMARGEPEPALDSFERAIRRAPTDAQAHHGAGRAHAALGDQQNAIREYHEASQLDPGWSAPLYDMGLAQLALGEYELAERSLRRALRLDPSNAEAATDLGLALAGQGSWADAAEAHLAATDLDPGLARAWLNLGLALKALGETAAAEAALRQALTLDPEIAGR